MSDCASPDTLRSASSDGGSSPKTTITTPASSPDTSPKLQNNLYYGSESPYAYQEPQLSRDHTPPVHIKSESPVPSSESSISVDALVVPEVEENLNDFISYYQYAPPAFEAVPSPTFPLSPTTPKYSGYPTASEFYGPAFASSEPSRYNTDSPESYESVQWYTEDGRRVECSAMHLQCATM